MARCASAAALHGVLQHRAEGFFVCGGTAICDAMLFWCHDIVHCAVACFFGAGALWLVPQHCIMLHVLPGVASLSMSLQWWLLCCFDTSTKIITTINLCGIGQACCLLCPWWWPHFTVIFCCSGCCIGIQKNKN